MIHMLVGRVLAGCIPAAFEFTQRGNQWECRFDGIDATAGLENMNRYTTQVNLQPDDSDLRRYQSLVERLRDECGIRRVAPLQTGERAITRAFLLDDRLKIHIGRRPQPGLTQRIQRKQVRDNAAFHISGAAPDHPVPADGRLEWRCLPHVDRPGRYDVDMSVQDQRFAAR